MKRALVVFDFDGLLIDSYHLLKLTFAEFGLDVGDESRFRNRRKFLKYFGGGRELLGNLATIALPRRKHIRRALTENYCEHGRIHPEFVRLLNDCVASATVHVGIVSRNFTLQPGTTIRRVLAASGVREYDLDFVVPVPIGGDKVEVLAAMQSPRYALSLASGDEVGDYRAALEAGYQPLLASYGFDDRTRLRERALAPEEVIHDSPADLARHATSLLQPWLW